VGPRHRPSRHLFRQRKIPFRDRISEDHAAQRAKSLFRNAGQELDNLQGDVAMDVIVISACLVCDEDARSSVNGGTELVAKTVEGARLECVCLSVAIDASENDDRFEGSLNRLGTHAPKYAIFGALLQCASQQRDGAHRLRAPSHAASPTRQIGPAPGADGEQSRTLNETFMLGHVGAMADWRPTAARERSLVRDELQVVDVDVDGVRQSATHSPLR